MEVKWKLGAPPETTLALPLLVTASVDGSWSDHSLELPRRPAILMIDGVDTGSKALRSLIEDDGHRVIVASGASAMLETLDKTPVDLVLLDMILADGMEFCQRIRANPRMDLIPVLMLS